MCILLYLLSICGPLFCQHLVSINPRIHKLLFLQNGETALHAACLFDHTNIVKLLLEHGADSSIKNSVSLSVFYLVITLLI